MSDRELVALMAAVIYGSAQVSAETEPLSADEAVGAAERILGIVEGDDCYCAERRLEEAEKRAEESELRKAARARAKAEAAK